MHLIFERCSPDGSGSRFTRRVAHKRQISGRKNLVGKSEERRHSGDLDLNGKIRLKCISNT